MSHGKRLQSVYASWKETVSHTQLMWPKEFHKALSIASVSLTIINIILICFALKTEQFVYDEIFFYILFTGMAEKKQQNINFYK